MSLRHAARAIVDRAASLTGVLGARERAMRSGLTVLMYHRVLPDDRCPGYHLPSLVMPLSVFQEQVRYLAAHCRVVTVRDGLALLAKGPGDGPALVSITFDDGYADNLAVAGPVLERCGVKATFYVTTGLIGTGQRLWFDSAAMTWSGLDWGRVEQAVAAAVPGLALPAAARASISGWMGFLKSLPTRARLAVLGSDLGVTAPEPDQLDRLMTPQELQELDRRGHEVASHSQTHPLLPQLSDAELDGEMTDSRRSLSLWLGAAPAGLCYPNGDHDQRVVDAARRAGYTYGCTTMTGRNGPSQDPFRLLRIDMNPRRVTRGGVHDELAMRAEISLVHEAVR